MTKDFDPEMETSFLPYGTHSSPCDTCQINYVSSCIKPEWGHSED